MTNIWTVVMNPAGSGTFISCSRWDVAGWRMGAPCSCPPTIGSGWIIYTCWPGQRVSGQRVLWFTLPYKSPHTRGCYTKGLSSLEGTLHNWISQLESATCYRCHAGAATNCHTKVVTTTGRARFELALFHSGNDKEEKENDEGDDYPIRYRLSYLLKNEKVEQSVYWIFIMRIYHFTDINCFDT